MKKRSIFLAILLLVCSFSMTVPAYAATNASDQISSYFMDVVPTSNSQIAIEFSITASYKMAVIGAQAITIYEKSGSSWTYVKSFSQNDDGMTRTNAYNYGNTIYYNGKSGTEYKVYVAVFAKDSAGASDSRAEIFYVTAA